MVLHIGRAQVEDFATFREGYNTESAKAFRDRHGVKNDGVFGNPDDEHEVVLVRYFDTAAEAQGFLDDPELPQLLQKLGVVGRPMLEVFHEV